MRYLRLTDDAHRAVLRFHNAVTAATGSAPEIGHHPRGTKPAVFGLRVVAANACRELCRALYDPDIVDAPDGGSAAELRAAEQRADDLAAIHRLDVQALYVELADVIRERDTLVAANSKLVDERDRARELLEALGMGDDARPKRPYTKPTLTEGQPVRGVVAIDPDVADAGAVGYDADGDKPPSCV